MSYDILQISLASDPIVFKHRVIEFVRLFLTHAGITWNIDLHHPHQLTLWESLHAVQNVMHTAVTRCPENQRPGGVIDALRVSLRHHPVTATTLSANVCQVTYFFVGHIGNLINTGREILNRTHTVHLGFKCVLL